MSFVRVDLTESEKIELAGAIVTLSTVVGLVGGWVSFNGAIITLLVVIAGQLSVVAREVRQSDEC